MTLKVYDVYVPHSGPEGSKILFVGEAPGEQEEIARAPFIGESGNILVTCLGRAGVSRDEVRLANLSHYRPVGNKFENLINTPQLHEGLEELYDYIRTYRPNVIGALGRYPLEYLTGKKGITKWRGSILQSNIAGATDIKVIPTFHPAYVARDRSSYPIFGVDVRRIISDGDFPELRLPERNFIINPQGYEREEWCERLCNSDWLGTDIETNKPTKKNPSIRILCIGFSPSPDTAVVWPWTPENIPYIQRVLEARAKKIFHFGGGFDVQVLALEGLEVKNFEWDTLVAQHCLEPELQRSLEYLTSVYTREPYYKTEGRGEIPADTKAWGSKTDKNKLYIYNGRDCCVTIEIALEQMIEFKDYPNRKRTFDFEMSEIDLIHHVSSSGLHVDLERREILRKALMIKWGKLQFVLDRLVGHKLNVNSPPVTKRTLYDELKLPPRRNGEGGLTTDEDAIVSLITYCKNHVDTLKREASIQEWTVKMEVCKLILQIRGIRKFLSSYILAPISADGRIRSAFKAWNTETGRWAAQKYIDGTGVNAQTFARGKVEVPDTFEDTFDIDALLAEVMLDVKAEDEEDAEVNI